VVVSCREARLSDVRCQGDIYATYPPGLGRGVPDMRIVRLLIGLVLVGFGIAFIASGNALGSAAGVATAAICGVPLFLLGLIVALTGLFGRQQQMQQQQQQQSVVIVPQYAPPPPQPAYYSPPPTYASRPPSVATTQVPAQGQASVDAENVRKFCPVCGNHYPPDYNVCPRDSSPLKTLQ
jgi:hypothetical protein